MKFNKLVRDKIPEIIINDGQQPVTHIASNEEYWQKLNEKLYEEVDEFSQSGSTEEIADILEVLDAILDHLNISSGQIKKIQQEKNIARGKFKKKIILDEIK